MEGKIGGWIAYFALVAAILAVGWNQPLRYKFLTPAEIAALEGRSKPRKTVDFGNWQPNGTSLDRAPYETSNSGVSYTGNIDQLKMGVRSEQGRRDNIYGSSH